MLAASTAAAAVACLGQQQLALLQLKLQQQLLLPLFVPVLCASTLKFYELQAVEVKSAEAQRRLVWFMMESSSLNSF